MTIQITSGFDAGNILVDACSDPNDIRLRIRKDNNSDFLQWFYFRAVGIAGTPNQFNIINADDTTYPAGWENYDWANLDINFTTHLFYRKFSDTGIYVPAT